jgi:pentatricopeptide repeat protein
MEARFLSHFSPSLMPPDALEAIFVQREELLCEVLERIRKSALTQEKQNTLLVGPRGIGKTHFTSLVYYKLQQMNDLQDHSLIAWLREEEWGIASFRDFLFRILRTLLPGDDHRLASIYSLPLKEAENAASRLVRELAHEKTLVLLIENFDELIQKIGISGEIQFFLFLRETVCCLLATSPGPVARIFPPGSPFQRGFFRIHQLSELGFEDAIQLISKIAQYQNNKELLSLIATPRGRARVRALRYLAGGNHRAYVVFAPLLIMESIDRMIEPFMQIIDDLTPYYNSKIAALPIQQRQLIEYICERRHPVRMNDIAQSCFMSPVSATTQLESLCSLGHLHSLKIGNDRYYELREPLMRLSFEVKKHRGKPVGLLLDFLRLWYSPSELKQKFSARPVGIMPEMSFTPEPQSLEQVLEDPRISECCRDYNSALKSYDYNHALEVAEELSALDDLDQYLSAQASCLIRLGRFEQALDIYNKMISRDEDNASLLQTRAWIFTRIGQYENALSSCRKSLELDPSVPAKCQESSILLHLGRTQDALQSCESAIKTDDKNPLAWDTLGIVLAELELFEEAFLAFSKVVELEPKNIQARIHLSASLVELNRWNDALEQAQSAIAIGPEEPEPWVLKGSALAGMQKLDDSLNAFEKAALLGEESPYLLFKKAELLFALDRWREGASHLDLALTRFAHSENPNAGDTKTLIRCLLPRLLSPEILQLSIRVLLLIYKKHSMLDVLGQGLIECIPEIISFTLSDTDSFLWRDAWQAETDHLPEFQLAVRFLDSAVRYRNSHDLEILMTLPQEERTMLETLLGVHVEAIA